MNPLSLSVLIVDDNDDYRLLLGQVLTNALGPIVIEEMATGQQLLHWLTQYRCRSDSDSSWDPCSVTIILLDMHMPGMSGLETLQSLGDMSQLPYMPVVMLTASVNERLKQQAYQQGIHLHMVKPVGPRGLYRVVEAIKLCYRDTLRLREQQKPSLNWANDHEGPPGKRGLRGAAMQSDKNEKRV